MGPSRSESARIFSLARMAWHMQPLDGPIPLPLMTVADTYAGYSQEVSAYTGFATNFYLCLALACHITIRHMVIPRSVAVAVSTCPRQV
jgi:hypothetical protein